MKTAGNLPPKVYFATSSRFATLVSDMDRNLDLSSLTQAIAPTRWVVNWTNGHIQTPRLRHRGYNSSEDQAKQNE